MSNIQYKKVLWAVDVFTDIPDLEAIAANNFRTFFEKLECRPQIHPICVFPGIGDEFPYVEEEIEKRIKKIKGLTLEPLKVIPEHMLYPPSVADQAKTLIDYAKENNFDLIMATTHAHHGINQFLLGSFTEILVHSSPLPLFIIDPLVAVRSDIKKVIMPIDYYNYKEGQVNFALDITKKMNSHLTFYHHIRDYSLKYLGLQKGVLELLRGRQQKIIEKANSEQIKLKEQVGVLPEQVEFITETNTLATKEAIVQCQRDIKADLIMIPQTYKEGGLPPLISGISTFVIQYSSCPVFIIK